MITVNRYELSSPKIKEEIFVEYTNGDLSAVLMPIKHPLTELAFSTLLGNLPRYEKDINNLAEISLTITKELPSNVKIAMFCEKYMEYHDKQKYKATAAEGKVIKGFKVTLELLDHYFTTTNFLFFGKHSIFNFTRYYNELLVDFNNKGKKKHPNGYSKEYAEKLPMDQLPDYWRHLTSLGLIPKKNSVGALMDWIKKV